MEAIVYFFFIHITLLVFGYSFVARFNIFAKHPGIQLSLGYMLSIAFISSLALLYYLFNIPPELVQGIFWITFTFAIVTILLNDFYKELARQWFVLTAFVLMSGLSLCVTAFSLPPENFAFFPDPEQREDRNYTTLSTKVQNLAHTRANDHYIPYRQAQFFVNKSDPGTDSFIDEWGVHFFQRTPLLGATTAGYFLSINDRPPVDYTWAQSSVDPDHTYAKFQSLAQVMNSIFVIPAFFLIRRLFNKNTAIVSTLFFVTSPFFLYNSFFTWPKTLVAFFIILSWLLLLSSKHRSYTIVAAAASGLAYLTHDLAVLYIGATVILLLLLRRFVDVAIIGLGSSLFALPWMLTASLIYHKASSFIYYPISTKDIPQPSQYKEIVQTFLSTSPLKLIGIRLESLFYLLTPYQLIVLENSNSFATRLWAVGIYSIPGSVGLGLFAPMLIGIYKFFSNWKIWILWLTPVILSVLVIGWPRGLGSFHFAEASIVILTSLAVAGLYKSSLTKWLYVAFTLHIIHLLYVVTFTYNFSLQLVTLKDLASALVITFVIAACSITLYMTIASRQKFVSRISDN